jgi:hypothetical protein
LSAEETKSEKKAMLLIRKWYYVKKEKARRCEKAGYDKIAMGVTSGSISSRETSDYA